MERIHEEARRSSLVAVTLALLFLCVAPASAQLTLVAYPGAGPQTPGNQTWTGQVGHGLGYYIIYAPPACGVEALHSVR